MPAVPNINRPRFELYDMRKDRNETTNLADDPRFAEVLKQYQEHLKTLQRETHDPWIMKWDYE